MSWRDQGKTLVLLHSMEEKEVCRKNRWMWEGLRKFTFALALNKSENTWIYKWEYSGKHTGTRQTLCLYHNLTLWNCHHIKASRFKTNIYTWNTCTSLFIPVLSHAQMLKEAERGTWTNSFQTNNFEKKRCFSSSKRCSPWMWSDLQLISLFKLNTKWQEKNKTAVTLFRDRFFCPCTHCNICVWTSFCHSSSPSIPMPSPVNFLMRRQHYSTPRNHLLPCKAACSRGYVFFPLPHES